MVQVILIEKIEKLGKIGDVVAVKPGYARNYLLPHNKALRATKDNLAVFEKQREEIEARNLDIQTQAEKQASQLDGKEIILIRAASESGQLYGSVTARDIASEVTEQLKQDVSHRHVHLENPVKTLGIFKQKLRFYSDVFAWVDLNVAKSAEEAVLQRQESQKEQEAAKRKQNKPAKDIKAEIAATESEEEAAMPADDLQDAPQESAPQESAPEDEAAT